MKEKIAQLEAKINDLDQSISLMFTFSNGIAISLQNKQMGELFMRGAKEIFGNIDEIKVLVDQIKRG